MNWEAEDFLSKLRTAIACCDDCAYLSEQVGLDHREDLESVSDELEFILRSARRVLER